LILMSQFQCNSVFASSLNTLKSLKRQMRRIINGLV